MKTVEKIFRNEGRHWVGDGFPVRSLFNAMRNAEEVSPFLLLDFAGPYDFEPNAGRPHGVEQHPHRGFETVTIVYDGEVSHRDSGGGGGTIRKGDVQWMTAGAGIVHEEFHSEEFSKRGGPFKMVQLWVNLPAKDKSSPPKYQHIDNAEIPVVKLKNGRARIIAGHFINIDGVASTFTEINMWDVSLHEHSDTTLPLPNNHNCFIVVLSGSINIGERTINEAQMAKLSANDQSVDIHSADASQILILTGEPINEPVVSYGPFVMNTHDEINKALQDFKAGKFGEITSN